MSNFYASMDLHKAENMQFKAMKREYKRGQSCAYCGDKLPMPQMTVDHIIAVADPEVNPFDMLNWQVLCLPCHRKKSKMELNGTFNMDVHQALKEGAIL